jgi:hypothetical protein
MDREHAADAFLEFLASARLPWPAAPCVRVKLERGRDGYILAAVLGVCKAPREDGERSLTAVKESAMEVVI